MQLDVLLEPTFDFLMSAAQSIVAASAWVWMAASWRCRHDRP